MKGPKQIDYRSLSRTALTATVVYGVFSLATRFLLPWLITEPGVAASDGGVGSLNLTSTIRQVKTEVDAATREMLNNNEEAMFIVKDFEIEINFVIHREASATTSSLVPISADSKVSSEKVQKIRLNLIADPNWNRDLLGTPGTIDAGPDINVK